MKKQTLLSEEKRKKILIELESKPKKFVELKKILDLNSNLLSYNLKILFKEKFIKKEGLFFVLTDKSKALMPYIHLSNDASCLPMSCVATIVRKNGTILIRKRTKEPAKGKGIFIGGKMYFGEDVFEACKRNVKEKVGIGIKNLKLVCINNYVSTNGSVKNHFVVFFVTAEPIGKPKNATWKKPSEIKRNMFPDNRFIIGEMLDNRKVKLISSTYDEVKNSFKVVNIS